MGPTSIVVEVAPDLFAPDSLTHARSESSLLFTAKSVWKALDEDDASAPVVVWLGYSVHGNESSGSNAALLVGYWLAAAQGEAVDRMLRDAVILIDPCINPDGLARFASWANMHRGAELVGDPRHREHTEPWPRGRTNHYWFDLNRDWLLLTHPESRGRIEKFHAWLPSVVADFHAKPNAP